MKKIEHCNSIETVEETMASWKKRAKKKMRYVI